MGRSISAVRAVVVVLAVAVAASMSLTACAGGGGGSGEPAMPPGANFTKDQVSRFVIGKGDFPSAYKMVDSSTRPVACDADWLTNQGAMAETPRETAVEQQLLALGPQACHLSAHEKTRRDGANPEAVSVTGYQLIAVVFPDPESASTSLAMFRETLSDAYLTEAYAGEGIGLGPAQDVATPGLGDESIPGIKRGPTRGNAFTPTTIDFVWRVRNVALKLSGGFGDDVSQGDVLQAARNISARAVG